MARGGIAEGRINVERDGGVGGWGCSSAQWRCVLIAHFLVFTAVLDGADIAVVVLTAFIFYISLSSSIVLPFRKRCPALDGPVAG